jgi:hypothetical protein
MIVLQANKAQKTKLEGVYKNGSTLAFTVDANGNYVIGIGCLTDTDYEDIWTDLSKLKQIQFNPKIYAE